MKKLAGIGFAVLLCLTLMSSAAYARSGDVISAGHPKPDWKIDFSEEWINPQPNGNGEYLFPLDNIYRADWVKTLWVHLEFSDSARNLGGELLTNPDTSKTFLYENNYQLADGWWVYESQENLFPQPRWEAVIIFALDTNGVPLPPDSIRYASMASMCTPEPTSMLLLGSGVVGLIGLGKKHKKED